MVLKVEFHSDTLHKPLLDTIEKYAAGSDSIDIAIGFLSQSGLNKIVNICSENPKIKNVRIVCGAVSGHAVNLSSKHSASKVIVIKIDFPYFSGKFGKYASMMHSKVYLFKSGKKRTSIVGSSNLTHFATTGKNVEANTIVTGDTKDGIFTDQQSHFDNIWNRSLALNHMLALYYDTLFKHCFQGFSYPEFKGPFGSDKSDTVHSIFSVLNKGCKLNIGSTIVFLNPPSEFQKLDEKYHLLHIGGDDFIYVKCLGGYRIERTRIINQFTFDFKIEKKIKHELEICGKIDIPAANPHTKFEVVKLVKAQQILSGMTQVKGGERSASNIIELLKFDEDDTITTKAREVEEKTNKELKEFVDLKKITGFKEPKANKLLALKITQMVSGIENNSTVCFFSEQDYFDRNAIRGESAGHEPDVPQIFLDTSTG